MTKIKLQNGVAYPIADYATPDSITIILADPEDAAQVIAQFNRPNLAQVAFIAGDRVSGIYTDKQLSSYTQDGGRLHITLCDRYDIVLTLDSDHRITAVDYPKYAAPGDIVVDALPDGDPRDYKYQDGRYIYDPMPRPPEPEPGPSLEERVVVLETDVDGLKTGYAAQMDALDAAYREGVNSL